MTLPVTARGLLPQTRAGQREAFNAHPPTDDQIWQRRMWTGRQWLRRAGVPWLLLRAHLRTRRFYLDGEGRLTRAPCGGCGKRYAVWHLNSVRICDDCGEGTPETWYHRELEKRRPQP